jgi:hypothetical protein
MKAAIICPTSMLEWLQKEFNPHFHLVLAQVYLKDKQYARFFQERREAGDEILLDQGAAERGASIEADKLMKVVRSLKPTTVVAPDVIYDSVSTVFRTGKFLKTNLAELQGLRVKVMAVPQGEDNTTYLHCFEMFNVAGNVDQLGISKFYAPRFVERARLLHIIREQVKKPCHLLGVWDDVSSLVEEKLDFITSVDTAKPIKLGLQGLSLSEAERRKPMPDFFSQAPANLELVRRNIEEYLEVVR